MSYLEAIFLMLLKDKSEDLISPSVQISMYLPHIFEMTKLKILIFFIHCIIGTQSIPETKKSN